MKKFAFTSKCHSELVSESQNHKMLKQVQHDRTGGFTLAEVLITLTIIGVIAALTIPNLMQKWQDHADVVKVKEAYSILSNALKMAIRENGTLDEWNYPQPNTSWSSENSIYLGNILQQYLKVAKNCKNKKGCYEFSCNSILGEHLAKNMCGNEEQSMMTLANGMSIAIHLANPITSARYFYVDINGLKGPNKFGYDMFQFLFDEKGIMVSQRYEYCNPQGPHWSDGEGQGCSTWIIKHGNMDYKYRDVSKEW